MQSFYNGLSGMNNFSRGLDNVSNNISNMNTPGYKGTSMFVRSLSHGSTGYGATIDAMSVRTEAGDLKQSNSDTDLAILGNGHFILKDEQGGHFYTRVGQFQFDENNKLVDIASGFNVMAIDDLGILREMDISEDRLLPPEATSEVKLIGNLDSNLETTHTISDLSVYDETGKSYTLSLEFTKVAAPVENTWDVVVKGEGDSALSTFQIQFGVDSTPLAASSRVSQTLVLDGEEQVIDFIIGEPGSFAGATQLISSTTNLAAVAEDGHEALGLRAVEFNEEGIIEFTYANGESETGQQVALAHFNDPSKLQLSPKGLMSARFSQTPTIGKPNHELFGSIQSQRIEMSNVDLTEEFADILIIQRGYQASSRVMSVSNEMLEQLYNNTRSG